MKYLKIVFVVVLFVFIGSCSLFVSTTTYYYTWHSGCTINGYVWYIMPGALFDNHNQPLALFTSKAYKFDKGTPLTIYATFWGEGIEYCWGQNITVSIMKSDDLTEGSIGHGGTVVATTTNRNWAKAEFEVD